MTSTELHKIKIKIMALANKTVDRGCSEEEAMSAMEKIGKLLEAYDLTMEECDVREEKCVSVKIPLRGARSGAAKFYVRNLARLFSAKHYRTTEYTGEGWKRRAAYVFYVQQHDAEAVKYLPAPLSRYLSSAPNYSWMVCGFLWGFRVGLG